RPETLRNSTGAAGARRTGDPRRPPLTEERIRLMLRVLADYALRSPRIRAMLLEPMRLNETGVDARKALGVRLATSADWDAGGAEGLMRDVFWMMLIRGRTGGGRNVDNWLEDFEATSTPAPWLGPEPTRRMRNMARFSAAASEEMVRLLCLVSRDEEAAVVACHREIDAFLRTFVGGPYALSGRGTRRGL
ncbi:MAG TPA: hypothetical protein VFR37_14105, partial [Longimicrobium sp.]|nr:hypothetical protein [Longimicrobium sp.]